MKGAASHYINNEICNQKTLEWQAGYGVVSFGTKDTHWVVSYIRNQKAHHANGTIHDRLERIDQPEHANAYRLALPGKPVETG